MKKFLIIFLLMLPLTVQADQQSLDPKTTPATDDVFQIYDTNDDPYNITYTNLARSAGQVVGEKPSEVSTLIGTRPTSTFIRMGAEGGDSSNASAIGGKGETYTMQAGDGGSCPNGTNCTGGPGGDIKLSAGSGGWADSVTVNTAGPGGNVEILGGSVGIGTFGTTNTEGIAGNVFIAGGRGTNNADGTVVLAQNQGGINIGGVGIGTTFADINASGGSVVNKLTAYGNTNSEIVSIMARHAGTGISANARISIRNDLTQAAYETVLGGYGSGATTTAFGQTLANWGLLFSSGTSTNGLIIGNTTADPILFGTNNAENMRIISGGNVGINTTAASEKLVVNGNIKALSNFVSADGSGGVTGGTCSAWKNGLCTSL